MVNERGKGILYIYITISELSFIDVVVIVVVVLFHLLSIIVIVTVFKVAAFFSSLIGI